MSLAQRLARHAAPVTVEAQDAADTRALADVYASWVGAKREEQALPVFFVPPVAIEDVAEPVARVMEAGAEVHFTRMTNSMISNDELSTFWAMLEGYSTQEAASKKSGGGKKTIDYMQFSACRDAVAAKLPKFTPFFAPHIFLALRRDAKGCIMIDQLFDVIMKKVTLQQTRLSLCLADTRGTGYVREKELEGFIVDQIAVMPHLAELDEGFHAIYAIYATRKFMFFLDPRRTGRIKITDIIASDVLAEFNELQQAGFSAAQAQCNWFSVPFVTRVHSDYIALDVDQNGMLSRKEIRGIAGGFMTQEVRSIASVVTHDACSPLHPIKPNPDILTRCSIASLRSAPHMPGSSTTKDISTWFWRTSIQSHSRFAEFSRVSYAASP